MLPEFPGQVLLVEHHRQDTLVNPFADQRASFYGVGPIPNVLFDGESRAVGAGSCTAAATEYRGMIQSRLDETAGVSPLAMDGYCILDGSTLHTRARIELLDPVALTELRAVLVLAEDDVFVQPSTFDHVTRAGAIEPITLSSPGSELWVEADFPLDPAWEPEQLACYAFVQTFSGTKEIYQAAVLEFIDMSVEEGVGTSAARLLRVAPNPVDLRSGSRAGAVTFRIDLGPRADGAPARLDLIDAAGRRIRTLSASPSTGGLLTLAWDGRDALGRTVAAGAYWARLSSTVASEQERVIVLR